MKTRRSTPKAPKITSVDEIPRTADCFYFDFLVNLICKYCKGKNKSNILGKKGRNQKSTYRKLSRNSKCEQAWSDEYALNPNITDGQVKLHVLSCRYIKIDSKFKIDIVKYTHKSKKRKVNN